MEEKIKSRTSLFTGKNLILRDKKGTTATPTDAFDFQKWKNSSLDPAGVLKMHIFFGMSHNFHKSMAAASVIFRSSGQTCQYMEPMYVIEGLGSHPPQSSCGCAIQRWPLLWQRKELYSLMPSTIILTIRKSRAGLS